VLAPPILIIVGPLLIVASGGEKRNPTAHASALKATKRRFNALINAGYCQPPDITMENLMDWNRVQGSWKQLEGKVKAKWGKLTADDLTAINGRREELEGKIQQRYGIAKDQARKEIDEWFTSQGF
jgi:uncharacterized protein YjbJ (UPF0337 family)